MRAVTTDFLPSAVRMVEISGSETPSDLLPEEERALGRVSEKRRREFADGRSCARQALAALGFAPTPILIGPHREPIWPAGVVGSITHCDGLRAAAVARASAYTSIGIDAEPNEPLPQDVRDLVILPEERRALANLSAHSVHWDRLLFCAKESFYKAWFPLTRRWLDFTDVEITFLPHQARFQAQLRCTTTEAERRLCLGIEGRCRAAANHLMALYGIATR